MSDFPSWRGALECTNWFGLCEVRPSHLEEVVGGQSGLQITFSSLKKLRCRLCFRGGYLYSTQSNYLSINIYPVKQKYPVLLLEHTLDHFSNEHWCFFVFFLFCRWPYWHSQTAQVFRQTQDAFHGGILIWSVSSCLLRPLYHTSLVRQKVWGQ